MNLYAPDGKLIGTIKCPEPPPAQTWDVWHFVGGIGVALVVAMVVFV